jgi:cytidylate kinase
MSDTLLTKEVLDLQNADTSNQIIKVLENDEKFVYLSNFEGEQIFTRDQEDDSKLEAGIQIGITRGSLPAEHNCTPYKAIDVLGKTPQQVVDVILEDVGEAANTGSLIVMCGLSGTGKGTTAALLKETLPNCVTWSNGNIFRSITLLAAVFCEQNGCEFDKEKALTDENIRSFMKMLRFEKLESGWDVVIDGLGISTPVGAIQNTELKAPRVAKNIPTVAQETQGEVINFASAAIEKMRQDGKNILLEGREQTVNYIPSPYRYTLTLSDPTLVGKRRAAQRLGAATASEVKAKLVTGLGIEGSTADILRTNHDGLVTSVLQDQAAWLAKEAGKN